MTSRKPLVVVNGQTQQLPAGDTVAGVDVGAEIHAATSKVTPVDADETALIDSAASNVLKKFTWANIKATLKSYFDTLYIALGGAVTTVTGTAPINSSGGTAPAISISAATTGAAGSMSAADKTKADAYPTVSGLTTGAVLRATGASASAFGAVDLANASAVTGTLADARLSGNVPLLNAANTFSAGQTITMAAAGQVIADITGNNAGASSLKLRKIRVAAAVQNGDYLGSFEGWGHDGSNYLRAGYLAWTITSAPATNAMPTAFVVAINGGSVDASEVARFTSAGMDAIGYKRSGVAGISATVTLAKITSGGANGSLTISGGIVTAYTAPT